LDLYFILRENHDGMELREEVLAPRVGLQL
jgi:hypothetical protein